MTKPTTETRTWTKVAAGTYRRANLEVRRREWGEWSLYATEDETENWIETFPTLRDAKAYAGEEL